MAIETYDVTLTLLEELLGTAPLNKTIYDDYIKSKHPKEDGGDDELLTIEEDTTKGMTGFHRLPDGTPILYDYVIKGFFKDACGMLRRVTDSGSSKLTAYRKVIDGLVFVAPRQIPIVVNGEEGVCERPLRAQTAQGERVALSVSEAVPVGSTISFVVTVLGGVPGKALNEWFTYGELRGLGQWRNSGKGRFAYSMTKR